MIASFEWLSLLAVGSVLVASVLYLLWTDSQKKAAERSRPADVKSSPVFVRPQPIVEMGAPCLLLSNWKKEGSKMWGLRSPIVQKHNVMMTPSSAKTLRVKTDEDRFLGSVVFSNKTRTIVMDAVFDGHGG